MTLTFGNTGNMTMTTKVTNEAELLAKIKASMVEEMYAAFAQQGLSKEQAEQAMLATYGMSISNYVDAVIKSQGLDQVFASMNSQENGVYYVANGVLYTAQGWNGSFEQNTFSLQSGQLRIEGLTSAEGGEMLVWRRG